MNLPARKPGTWPFAPPLNPNDPSPLYLKVMRAIRLAIEQNLFEPDSALPPERELAELFGVSRITVRKALADLAEQGLLHRRQGAGNFVAAEPGRIEKSLSRITSFSEDMLARQRKPHSEWVSKSEGTVTPEEAMALGLSPGSSVYRFVRTRFADEMPMALEFATVPSIYLPSVDAVDQSLYAALDALGHRPARALQRLRAINVSAEHAAYLKVPAGSAATFEAGQRWKLRSLTTEATRTIFLQN
jgi:GntR family transcriptional regulator